MNSEAATCAERATSDMLIGPDWSINIELCDIINGNPGQAKDALKVLKRQLGSRNPQIQLLTLDVLDSLSKNCGNKIFQEISDADILQDLINVINKKPDLRVREKVLILIDTWQEALGGSVGRYPQYYAAYLQLVNAGVKFPPREKNNVPLFTPPQNQPVVNIVHHNTPVRASPQTDASPLSVTEFKSISELADILKEMLGALGPRDCEGAKEEVIMDLVDQCRTYQQRVMLLLNSTSDEDLLFQGLALNDTLLNVLHQHENLVKVIAPTVTRPNLIPQVNKVYTDDSVEDDLGQLSQRSKARKALRKTGSMPVSPLLPPPPSSNNPVVKDANLIDFLSGDLFTSEIPGLSTKQEFTELPSNSSSNTHPASKAVSPSHPNTQDDPFWLGEVHGDNYLKEPPSAAKSSFSPPSSSKTDTTFDFFDQPDSHSHQESPVSFASSLETPMQTLKLNPDTSTPIKEEKPHDDPFKDLLDFARAKPSTPSSSRSNKRLS